MSNKPDIIEELAAQILHLLAEGKSVSEAIQIAEEACRRCYGGGENYVKKTRAEETRQSRRDRTIVRLFERGEHIEYLALRFHLSPRRIRQIVSKE